MKVIKWEPSTIGLLPEGSAYYANDKDYSPDGGWATGPISRLPESLAASLRESVRVHIETNRDVIGPYSDSDGRVTGYAVVSGKPDPKPEDIIQKVDISRGAISNRPFHARVKKGEIVVAPYSSKGIIEVRRVAGLRDTTSVAHSRPAVDSSHASTSGFTVVGDRLYFEPRWFIKLRNTYFRMNRRTYTSFWLMPDFFKPEQLQEILQGKFEPNENLVTQVWADNNVKRMDFLTAMAEMPQTLSSALDALGYLGSIIQDFRKRRFFLNKETQRTKQRIGMSAAERRREIETRFNNRIRSTRKPNVKQRLRLQKGKALRNLEKSVNRDVKKAVRESTTKAASLWLSYRYEIMPLWYQAQDALDVIASATSEFLTSRDRIEESVDIGIPVEWNLDSDLLSLKPSHRVMVKSKLDPSNNIGKTLSVNPFLTAWELLTLSFVVDWFLNIGDVIASFTGGYSEDSGSTASWKFDDTITLKHKTVSGAFVRVTINFYKRVVIDPRLCAGLTLSPNLNFYRSLDAMSLSWNRSKLKISSS